MNLRISYNKFTKKMLAIKPNELLKCTSKQKRYVGKGIPLILKKKLCERQKLWLIFSSRIVIYLNENNAFNVKIK